MPNFSGQTLVILITLLCSTSFMLFGYDQGVFAGIIGADNQFGHDFNHPDANTQGLIISVYHLGNVGGSILTFFVGDYLGRKKSVFWATFVMFIGAILQTASVTRGMLFAARVISGIGNGAITSTIPVYQAETSTAKERGKLVAIGACIIVCGAFIAYWVHYGFSEVSGPAQWSMLSETGALSAFKWLFMLVIFPLILILPDTPRWLHKQGRHAEADAVISRLVGKNVSTDDPRVLELSKDITDAIELESAGGPFRWQELFQGGKLQNFRRICIAFCAGAFQQLGGICAITYYLPVILVSQLGMSRHMALLFGGIITTEYFLATIVQIWLVNRFKRRTLIFLSSGGEIISMAVMAICIRYNGYGSNILYIIMVFAYNTFFAFGWLTIAFVYPAEVTTLRLRAKGAAVASVGTWIIEFMVVQITPICVQNIGYKIYILFVLLNAGIIVPVSYFFFPETAKMRLEDIDYIFEAGGITGGVLAKGGHFIDRRGDIEEMHHHGVSTAFGEKSSASSDSPKGAAHEVRET